MDDGILVVESWLISVTEYIAINNTPLRPRVHVDGRLGLARPDQSVGWSRLAEDPTTILLLIVAKNKHCFIL